MTESLYAMIYAGSGIFLCEYWRKWLIRILFYHLYQVAFYVNFKCLFFIIPCWTRGDEFFVFCLFEN